MRQNNSNKPVIRIQININSQVSQNNTVIGVENKRKFDFLEMVKMLVKFLSCVDVNILSALSLLLFTLIH